MKIENRKVKLTSLFPAPWNPREQITPESVSDLAANIKANGLLHNIGVWTDPKTGGLFVAYGNRRAVACGSIGMEEVDAKVYSDCSESEAQLLTRAENELRLDIDPLKDAELLGKLHESGMNEKEIAAHFGLPIARVCRRLKLVTLSEEFRELIRNGYRFTTDALERISAFPKGVQIAASVGVGGYKIDEGTLFGWSDIADEFTAVTRDLDFKRFSDCETCPKRTGAQPDLFGDMADASYGRCLDCACYKRHVEEEFQKKVDAAIDPAAVARVKIKHYYDLNAYGTKRKPDAKNQVAYWAEGYNGGIHVVYGPSEDERKKRDAKTRKARAAAEKKDAELRNRRTKIQNKYTAWMKSGRLHDALEKIILDDFDKSFDFGKMVEVMLFFGIGDNGYRMGDKTKEAQMKFSLSRTFETWWEVCGYILVQQSWRFADPINIPRTMKFLSSVDWGDVFTHEELEFINSEEFVK